MRVFYNIKPTSETKDGPVSINPSELNTLSQVASMPDSELKQYLEDKLPNYSTCLGSEKRNYLKMNCSTETIIEVDLFQKIMVRKYSIGK